MSEEANQAQADLTQLLEYVDKEARPRFARAVREFSSYVARTGQSSLAEVDAQAALNSNDLSEEEREALKEIETIGPLLAVIHKLREIAGLPMEPQLFEAALDRDAYRVCGGPWVPGHLRVVEVTDGNGIRRTVCVKDMAEQYGAQFGAAFNEWVRVRGDADATFALAVKGLVDP